VEVVIGKSMMSVVDDDDSVKVMKAEEPGEPKSGPPERIGDPGIHVIIIRGRGVVSNNRRSLVVVVVIDHFGV
jgi:hypothetical protein